MNASRSRDEHARFVAIDYGTKRIGLAISDPLEMFAVPLDVLQNDNRFWINLKRSLAPYKIKAFVLGYPLKENGEKTSLSDEVRKFSETLKKKFGKDVILIDERYSSSIAEEQIAVTVKSKKKRRDKGLIDMKAAAVILQSYLDEKK